ncbi:MAG TPA: hypothetical protein VHG51_16765 [Longimicrobiaceae bacterium]|nr:hypothetical protein [Longimicrobiaceae bacterium]
MPVLSLLLTSAALAAAPCEAAPARCSCIPPRPPLEALAQADAVFSGTVVSVEERRGEGGMGELEVRIVPDRRWKGAAADTVVVHTADNSAACGVAFAPGEAYLVYAYGSDGLRASLCSRTAPLAQAADDEEALGTPGRTRIPVRKDAR